MALPALHQKCLPTGRFPRQAAQAKEPRLAQGIVVCDDLVWFRQQQQSAHAANYFGLRNLFKYAMHFYAR